MNRMKYLPNMLSLGAVKFKRVKSSRRLDVFNPTTNKLLSGERSKAASNRLPPVREGGS